MSDAQIPFQLLLPKEVAKILGVSVSTLAAWRHKRSDGPIFIRVGRRAIRYDRTALFEWIKKQERVSTSDPRDLPLEKPIGNTKKERWNDVPSR